MVLYPNVQAKAQAELDAVVGNDRLPSFSDCNSLPYVNRVWKEVLQWHAIVLLGTISVPLNFRNILTSQNTAVTHVATEDIHYEGYLIPKGSHILGNAGWVSCHDYIRPHTFIPDIYLTSCWTHTQGCSPWWIHLSRSWHVLAWTVPWRHSTAWSTKCLLWIR